MDLDPHMDFVLLATHGLFAYLSPEEAIELVWSSINNWKSKREESGTSVQELLSEITKDLIQTAIIHGSEDNISVMIVLLPSFLSNL